MAIEAGFPNTNDIMNAFCDDKEIKTKSSDGSNTIKMYIYSRESTKGNRIQSYMGTKNLGIVMPDADIDATLKPWLL